STREMARLQVLPCGPHKLMAAVVLVALLMPWQSTCTSILPDFKSCVEECWLKYNECCSNICTRDEVSTKVGIKFCQLQRKACLQACVKELIT
ncbi:hypothetical protein LSAT2_007535, partial [Lamellibrachia satsuma]